nr:hypothetical protein [Tanacetum cinerariifolium]
PERDGDSKEQHHDQCPGRGIEPAVDTPADQRAADETSDQGGEHAIAERISRIGRRRHTPRPQRFLMPGLLQSLIERGEPRILRVVEVLSGSAFRHAPSSPDFVQ